ncbi:hypothetical protein [Aromatoleum buckelii]|nr:hypothetical protein [Aromatoleum buckelii]MCK0512302.1 hypothetical protein [Aromatoleum buckelii]
MTATGIEDPPKVGNFTSLRSTFPSGTPQAGKLHRSKCPIGLLGRPYNWKHAGGKGYSPCVVRSRAVYPGAALQHITNDCDIDMLEFPLVYRLHNRFDDRQPGRINCCHHLYLIRKPDMKQSLLVAALLTFALSACGEKEEPAAPPPPAQEAAPAAAVEEAAKEAVESAKEGAANAVEAAKEGAEQAVAAAKEGAEAAVEATKEAVQK